MNDQCQMPEYISCCRRLTALLLVLVLLLTSCSGPTAKATAMKLVKAEGTVAVSDSEGKSLEPVENLGLYSGYQVRTRTASYAWVDLDEVKLTKIDEKSKIEIQQEDKHLTIEVRSGSLFFNVTEPLEDDETLDIRVSSMLVGIRGTCGWVLVSKDRDTMTLYLLEGTVECSTEDETVFVNAGEMAVMTRDSEITISEFTAWDIPGFVMEEIEDDDGLVDAILEDSGIDVLNPLEPDPVEDALAAYRPIVEQAASYFADDTDYGDMEVTKIYTYALVQMQTEYPIPALILEQETYGDYWGDLCDALVFQYDPDSETVIQAEGWLGEGVASAGGYRGSLSAAADGNGILETSWSSGTGEGVVERVTVDGNFLNSVTVWSGNVVSDEASSGVEGTAIDWHEITDLTGLDSRIRPVDDGSAEADEQGQAQEDGPQLPLTEVVNATDAQIREAIITWAYRLDGETGSYVDYETLRGRRIEEFHYYIDRFSSSAVITFEPGECTTDPDRRLEDMILPFPLR